MDAPFPGFEFRPVCRRMAQWVILPVAAWILSGCAKVDRRDERGNLSVARVAYAVRFSAVKLKDHSPIVSAVVPLRLDQRTTTHTSASVATEDAPALPKFTATLSRTRTPGLFQLTTKIAIREAIRNKKGKLKVGQRNQGALLPARLGESQTASVATDPVQIAVRLERH